MTNAIQDGAHCLLRVLGQQFWVQVIETGDNAVRVSFPGQDYPLEGMLIELELHEEDGYRLFTTHMVGRGPGADDGIVLAPPQEQGHRFHRASIRVSTNLPVSVKDQVSVRWQPGQLINISKGGALITTEAEIAPDSTVDIKLDLPGEPTHAFLAQVRHLNHAKGEKTRHAGVMFVNADADALDALERYIAVQLRATYPTI